MLSKFRRAVRRAAPQITVWCVGDAGAPALGAKDPEILRWCEAYNFILVTDNRRSMPVHLRDHLAAGGHIAGIFVLRPDLTMGAIVDELSLIREASLPDEYRDRICYLPLSV